MADQDKDKTAKKPADLRTQKQPEQQQEQKRDMPPKPSQPASTDPARKL